MSLEPTFKSIYPPMTKPEARSTLYRLIEAGQLAHKALLVPLLDRGLEAELGASEAALAEHLGLEREVLQPRLARLIERDIVARQAIGPDLTDGLALTERGARIREVLAANWEQLEEALFADLDTKKRKCLTKALKRFVELLRLA
jgi:DNA-binding MarR family transcriptional regulator